MPNHFHLAVRSFRDPRNISKMMQSSMTKFCVYINKRYHLVGRTFQGTYKHRTINNRNDLHGSWPISEKIQLKQVWLGRENTISG